MSYDRMQEEEKRLQEEIATMLAEAQAADETDDARHGPDRHGDELPAELARRQSRLAKIQQGKALLEERVQAAAVAERPRRQPEGRAPRKVAPAEAVPEP